MGLHLSKFKSGSHSCERTHLSRQKKGVGRLGHPWVNSFELYITYPTDSYRINMSDCCKSINWFPIMFYFDSVAGLNCSTCWAFSFECGILNKPKKSRHSMLFISTVSSSSYFSAIPMCADQTTSKHLWQLINYHPERPIDPSHY